MEALIGAVYLDQGWAAATELVMRLLGDLIEQAAVGPGGQDYKTRLQELCARRFDELPHYQVADDGPDHAKRFDASVRVGGTVWGTGQGRSKKQAEQAAARMAWAAHRRPTVRSKPDAETAEPMRSAPAPASTDAASAPAAGRA